MACPWNENQRAAAAKRATVRARERRKAAQASGEALGRDHPVEYAAWASMKAKCRNPKLANYRHFGALGTAVWHGWESFARFFEDVGPRPSPRHRIRLIDGDGDFTPTNAGWSLRAPRRRKAPKATVETATIGGATLPLADWLKRYGVKPSLYRHRLGAGWTTADAIQTPPRRRPGHDAV